MYIRLHIWTRDNVDSCICRLMRADFIFKHQQNFFDLLHGPMAGLKCCPETQTALHFLWCKQYQRHYEPCFHLYHFAMGGEGSRIPRLHSPDSVQRKHFWHYATHKRLKLVVRCLLHNHKVTVYVGTTHCSRPCIYDCTKVLPA